MNKSLVDSAWTCGCGALNAGYLLFCGRCNKKEMRKLLFNMVLTNEISEEAMHKILDTYYISGYGRK